MNKQQQMKNKAERSSKIILAILVGIFVIGELFPDVHIFMQGGLQDDNGKIHDTYYIIGDEYYALDKETVLTHHGKGHLTFLGEAIMKGEVWRLLSGALIHGNLLHIAFNCYFLWQIIPFMVVQFGEVKTQLALWLSVIGGAVLSGALKPEIPGVGISGGLFGLFAIYTYTLWMIKKQNPDPQIAAAFKSALFMLGINVVIGLTAKNISMSGHIGGFIVGLVLAYFYIKSMQNPRQRADYSNAETADFRSYDEYNPH